MASPALDVVALRARLEQRFRVYDVQTDDNVVAFYIDAPKATLETDFEALKRELRPEGLVPLLKYQGGEHAIYILRSPTRAKKGWKLNAGLFVATLVTTTLAGAVEAFSYYRRDFDVANVTQSEYLRAVFTLDSIWIGFLTFALPLMLILTVHEFGHYFMARRHGMDASLPFFIPFPPLTGLNIGTLGAFIGLREPMPSRKVLFDVGIAGPLAGIIIAIPVTILGFVLMAASPVLVEPDAPGTISIVTPLLYDALATPFGLPDATLTHPIAFAGFVGMFLTAFNLFPVGQLDGGHVAYAMFGKRAHYVSYGVIVAFIGIGITPLFGLPGTSNFLLPAMLLGLMGVRHPPTLDGVSDIDRRRVMLGWLTFGLAVLCFTPILWE